MSTHPVAHVLDDCCPRQALILKAVDFGVERSEYVLLALTLDCVVGRVDDRASDDAP
jgi:hypothetical protein